MAIVHSQSMYLCIELFGTVDCAGIPGLPCGGVHGLGLPKESTLSTGHSGVGGGGCLPATHT